MNEFCLDFSREEEIRNTMVQKHADPYSDHRVLNKFVAEAKKFETMVQNLSNSPAQGGLSTLDQEWKVGVDFL